LNKKYIYFFTCSIIWGLTWIAIKLQLGAGDPNITVFYRFSAATLLMVALAVYKKESFIFSGYQHLLMVLQGLFMFSLNFLLTYWASSMAPSALISLGFTALIFFNMIGARLFMKMPLEKKVIVGAIISFIGMGLITINEIQDKNLEAYPFSFLGFLISLVGTVSASAGNLVSFKNRQLGLPIIANTAFGMMYGSVFTMLFCLAKGASFSIQVSPLFVYSFFYLTVFGTVISFISYLKLIQIVGPSKAAFTSVISPIIALIVSTVYENLQWSVLLGVGIVLCLIGNCVALISNFRRWS
jgi:drug/metabolite transporter (DMT)-like permease